MKKKTRTKTLSTMKGITVLGNKTMRPRMESRMDDNAREEICQAINNAMSGTFDF